VPKYDIVLKPSAIRNMDKLRRYDAVQVADAIEAHLSDRPTRVSRSRIKKLRGIRNPDYRLLAGEFRVFYGVDDTACRVDVLRVMHKNETHSYYTELSQ